MPLHRVVKQSPNPVDDLVQVVRRLERNGHRILQVNEQPTEWLILADLPVRGGVETRGVPAPKPPSEIRVLPTSIGIPQFRGGAA